MDGVRNAEKKLNLQIEMKKTQKKFDFMTGHEMPEKKLNLQIKMKNWKNPILWRGTECRKKIKVAKLKTLKQFRVPHVRCLVYTYRV